MRKIILDVSNNNPIALAQLKQAKAKDGVVALICKATEGTTFEDATLSTHRKIAKTAGIPFGSYLFIHPDSTGSEAKYYLDYAKPKKGEIQPVIDCEVTDKTTYAAVGKRVHSCASALKKAGYNPILYTGPYFWLELVKAHPELKKLRLWEAQYPAHYSKFQTFILRLRIKLNGAKTVMWQFTDAFAVDNKKYDASVLVNNTELHSLLY
jgi:lysozyme